MAKTASLKYNLANKQTKIYAIWIESRKRTNKKKKGKRQRVYILVYFYPAPVYTKLLSVGWYIRRTKLLERRNIKREGGRLTKDASSGEICHLTHRWKREWKMTVLEKKLDWENSLYNLRVFSCLFSSFFFSSHEPRGGTHIVAAASFPMGQPYYTRGKDMSRFIMGIAVAASTSSSIHIRSWLSLSFFLQIEIRFLL